MPPPTRRPLERFWPYVELTEAPTPDELAALDPDLHAALFGPRDLPFSMTLVFPDFAGQGFVDAIAKAEAARRVSRRRQWRRPASPGAVLQRRRRRSCANSTRSSVTCRSRDVLIDDRPVPFARELWLPLLWFHLLS